MGFLDKINPKATAWSVLRAAIFQGILGAAVGAAAIYFKEKPLTGFWPIPYALWVLGCMVVGAIFEWQVPEDTDILIEMDRDSERDLNSDSTG